MPLQDISTANTRDCLQATPSGECFPLQKKNPEKSFYFEQLQTFSNFVSNRKHSLILSALHELLTSHQETAIPVILSGASGTGKTHLLRASAHMLTEAGKKSYLSSIDHLTQTDFHHIFSSIHSILSCKAFLLDNMHLPASADIQHFLCSVLDAFTEKGYPVIISGTGLITDWPCIAPLRSRLHAGLLFSLPDPDIDIFLRIIQKYTSQKNLSLSRDIILQIARQCSDIRGIQGVLRHIAAYRRLTGSEISTADLNNILFGQRKNPLTPQAIICQVSKKTGLTSKDILGKSRRAETVFARQIAMFLCRELLGLSYPVIGHIFGNKNHSSVIYAIKKIKQSSNDNNVTNNLVTELAKICKKG